jgi:hypothetical protein
MGSVAAVTPFRWDFLLLVSHRLMSWELSWRTEPPRNNPLHAAAVPRYDPQSECLVLQLEAREGRFEVTRT